MKRRTVLLAGVGVLIVAGLVAPMTIRTPPGADFPSFPAEDRRTFAEKIQCHPLPGTLKYSAYFVLPLREPLASAVPKLDRDLKAQGFRGRYVTPQMASWEKPGVNVLAVSHDGSRPYVSVTRRATLPESLAAWLRQRR